MNMNEQQKQPNVIFKQTKAEHQISFLPSYPQLERGTDPTPPL